MFCSYHFVGEWEKYKVGDRVKVDVMRNNKRLTVDVTLQAVN